VHLTVGSERLIVVDWSYPASSKSLGVGSTKIQQTGRIPRYEPHVEVTRDPKQHARDGSLGCRMVKNEMNRSCE